MKLLTQKWIAVLCICAISFQLCACAGTTEEAGVTAPAASASDSSSAESVSETQEDSTYLEQSTTEAVPIPVVEVTDAKDFSEKLGISIDPSYLAGDKTMNIIAEKMAEINYSVTNVDGNEVLCTLRAAKPGSYSGDICGIVDEMTETTEEYACNESTVAVKHKTPKTEPYEIYEFTYENVDYCFMYQGELSNMLLGELFDGILCAIGAEEAGY